MQHLKLTLATMGLSLAGMAGSALAQNPFQFSDLTVEDYNLGTRQYLVIMQNGETGEMSRPSLWTRTTRVAEIDGEPVIEIIQDWFGDDPRMRRHILSHNRVDDFSPIDHFTRQGKDEPRIDAFVFDEDSIEGDPFVENNERADFTMASVPETLNWELDMEAFALLPLGEGKSFDMNFYHPGSSTGPADYTYTVIGEDKLDGIDRQVHDTWMLKIDYSETNNAIFWLSKKTGEMLKMKEHWNGNYRYKLRLGVVGGVPASHK